MNTLNNNDFNYAQKAVLDAEKLINIMLNFGILSVDGVVSKNGNIKLDLGERDLSSKLVLLTDLSKAFHSLSLCLDNKGESRSSEKPATHKLNHA